MTGYQGHGRRAVPLDVVIRARLTGPLTDQAGAALPGRACPAVARRAAGRRELR